MISLILSAPAVKREQKRQAICIAILFNKNSFSDTKIEKKKEINDIHGGMFFQKKSNRKKTKKE